MVFAKIWGRGSLSLEPAGKQVRVSSWTIELAYCVLTSVEQILSRRQSYAGAFSSPGVDCILMGSVRSHVPADHFSASPVCWVSGRARAQTARRRTTLRNAPINTVANSRTIQLCSPNLLGVLVVLPSNLIVMSSFAISRATVMELLMKRAVDINAEDTPVRTPFTDLSRSIWPWYQ